MTYDAKHPDVMARLPAFLAAHLSITHSDAMDDDMLQHIHHDVRRTWQTCTACIISLGLDHCIAGDCNVHCESHLWLHPESARP